MNKDIKLCTPVKIDGPKKKFDLNTVITGIGSCFAQDVLGRFFAYGFDGAQNPNGIVYNAVSIADSIKRVLEDVPYTGDDFFENNGLWCSWAHHGSFSSSSLDKAVDKTEEARKDFRQHLAKSGMFIVTPSSSVVYRYKKTHHIVANCHKVPNNLFKRHLLSFEENLQALCETVEAVQAFNSDCMTVITLSPVRHYPGDLILNSRSKALILAAIRECTDAYKNVTYFPSYEIVVDEMRDYRFYNEDMLHPSELARKIIFQRFLKAFFEKETIEELSLREKQILAGKHRPLR